MPINKFIVFKGAGSMTGKATKRKFPGLAFENGKEFNDILETLVEGKSLAILPLWNSHVGEIARAKIIEYMIERGLLIHSIWPDWIEFACIVRKGTRQENIKSVISMEGVADKQCSGFIDKIGAKFSGKNSTKDAYDEFNKNNNFDAVLCNAELCDRNTQEVLEEDVSNELNFTTFVLLGKDSESEWIGENWDVLREVALPKECRISCVEMPAIEGTLSEDQHVMFDMLVEDCKHINEIPKIIFVSEREGGEKVGLVLEYKASDDKGFPDIGIMSDVRIQNNAGSTKTLYAESIRGFISNRYNDFLNNDFVKHIGDSSCFYSSPPLNIMTHGFDQKVVEALVRESIKQHFSAIEKGVTCGNDQKKIFEKYKKDYHEKGNNFPYFKDL